MSRLLGYLGYRAVGLSDPVEALRRFRLDTGAFDLVIIDKNMPNMSGTELAKEVLRIRPGMPVIMCTGYSETADEERALAMGIRALVLKPSSVKEMAALIRRVLRSET
jgi:CheY-like chemotaxis protein